MIFSSSLFLVYFLPIFLLVYCFVDKSHKNNVILLASIVFYAWGEPTFIFILLLSTIIDFYLVKRLHQASENNIKKRWLLLSLTMNLGLLAYFKYANFFIENVNSVLTSAGVENVAWTNVLLPIGISFYTFQTLTYSIDVYRKVSNPLDNLRDYLVYILSFPQMIAGPIVRFNLIADQIVNRIETVDDRLQGFFRFSIGLAKKVLIANAMGEQADLIMNQAAGDISTPTAWIGILAYTFQIYFDFAGYSDMAIGLGRMMGFTFPENFKSPYTSQSISEFWRRWHITLGDWMRDYLYIPLGGNRVGSKARLYFNLWFVFLISGLWHGASWNFVIWGAFHGLFLILDRLFLLKTLNKIGKIPAVIFTFFIVIIGWVFFRLEKFSDAIAYLSRMFAFDNFDDKVILEKQFLTVFCIAVFFSFFTLTKWGKRWEIRTYEMPTVLSTKQSSYLVGVSLLLFIVCLSYIAAAGFNPFIYFRF
ncbi:MAG: alginate O-acetyltransferase complex protein AlgI [Paraglaciecola sp.]|jgi:alginate O-acetyltransferase complex protein AlgI